VDKKEMWIRFCYRGRVIRRQASFQGAYVILIVSLLLFALALSPDLRRLAASIGLPANANLELRVTGTAFLTPAGQPQQVAIGVVVHVGGFRSVSGADGRYSLQFDSKERQGVPLVAQLAASRQVIILNFPASTQQVDQDLFFP